MELSLRQITNTLGNQQNSLKKLASKAEFTKQTGLRFPFKRLVSINSHDFNFGSCIPNTVHQRILTLTLREDLSEPLSFVMSIDCEDQNLNNLPQFVFAIKKDKELQFTDCYRFRLSKRGKYDFVIGVKTPNLDQYTVKSQLKIFSELSDLNNENQLYSVKLQQRICMPLIQCSRQLLSSQVKTLEPLRVLKFSLIKSKLKKQVKIPFKLETDTKLTLINELMGISHERDELEKNLIQIHSKQVLMTGKGVFIMTFKFNFTEQISEYLQLQERKNKLGKEMISYTLRRILLMRVNQTNIYFHFPIEVNFFLGYKSISIYPGE